MTEWHRLRGKRVRVHASGVIYRGVLLEMGEGSLVLRTESTVQEIPWDRISQVAEEPEGNEAGALGRS